MNDCYCKGIILIVGGILFLLENLQMIQLGIAPYLPLLFIILGIMMILPVCFCGGKEK
ncbi:hypothetical protein GF369_01660 [Candidatus Peregrinibacteria bacterium]|nr:hypothetical protein [Candidatus Peregrinibacteria bacterium]